MTKLVLDTITSGISISTINQNFAEVATEMQNKVLYRDNPAGEPNTMLTALDMNSQRIFNLPVPAAASEAARLQDVQDAVSGAQQANLITSDPSGDVSATNVQGAINELAAEKVSLTSLATSTGSRLVGGGEQVVSSIAALRLLLITSPSKNAFVAGYYAAGDGGGGSYYYDSADITTVDNGGTVIVAADGGRWKMVATQILSLYQFGIVGDGIADDTVKIQAAIVAAYSLNSDLFFTGDLKITDTLLLYPNVKLMGAGIDKARIEFATTSKTAFRTHRPAGYVPTLALGCGLTGFTVNGQSAASGNVGLDISDSRSGQYTEIEFANFTYGLYFNKNAKEVASPFDGQAYFNEISRCHFASCTSGVAFGGAANRNTFTTNTYTNCSVAYDFGILGNVAETNIFINENIEGCNNWAEWPAAQGNIFSQTWVGTTIENPTTNGFVCTVKDPGRQNFYGLALIPAEDALAVDFFSLFTGVVSLLVGSKGSSGGFSFKVRIPEILSLYDFQETKKHAVSAPFTASITAGSSATTTVTLTGAVLGDIVMLTASQDLLGCILTGYVSATNTISVRIQNGSGGNVGFTSLNIYATVIKRS